MARSSILCVVRNTHATLNEKKTGSFNWGFHFPSLYFPWFIISRHGDFLPSLLLFSLIWIFLRFIALSFPSLFCPFWYFLPFLSLSCPFLPFLDLSCSFLPFPSLSCPLGLVWRADAQTDERSRGTRFYILACGSCLVRFGQRCFHSWNPCGTNAHKLTAKVQI